MCAKRYKKVFKATWIMIGRTQVLVLAVWKYSKMDIGSHKGEMESTRREKELRGDVKECTPRISLSSPFL